MLTESREAVEATLTMAASCKVDGCRSSVPAELSVVGLCIPHFTRDIEETSAAIRREVALGTADHERQVEIMRYISETGQLIERVATSGLELPIELKVRVLVTFLKLTDLRANFDRAVQLQTSLNSSPEPAAVGQMAGWEGLP